MLTTEKQFTERLNKYMAGEKARKENDRKKNKKKNKHSSTCSWNELYLGEKYTGGNSCSSLNCDFTVTFFNKQAVWGKDSAGSGALRRCEVHFEALLPWPGCEALDWKLNTIYTKDQAISVNYFDFGSRCSSVESRRKTRTETRHISDTDRENKPVQTLRGRCSS